MSRRDWNNFDLSAYIDKYKELKDKENAFKKQTLDLGNNIKGYMYENDMTSANSEKYTATLSCTKKESLNEDLAIEIIKENLGGALLSSVIKLVYNGDFDITKLAKAKIVKETYTLRVNKKKDD